MVWEGAGLVHGLGEGVSRRMSVRRGWTDERLGLFYISGIFDLWK
jgi:hypothetical protein